MGAVYKRKKGSSCPICKPWKNGILPKKKLKTRVKESEMKKEMREYR